MGVLLRFGAIFIVALKRLFSQRRLALLTVLGLTAAVALTLSIPLYADAVYYKTLREALGTGQGQTEPSSRPPFAFMFRYIGAWYGAAKWSDIQAVDSYLSNSAGPELGLPQKELVRFFKTDNLALFAAKDKQTTYDTQHSLSWLSLGSVSNVEKHITLVEGRLPVTPTGSADAPIETLMSEQRAAELGLHAGEQYVLYGDKSGLNNKSVQIPITVVGVYKATDPNEDFWFYAPNALADVLLVPEEALKSWIAPRLKGEVYVALWYLIMDGDRVRSADSLSLLQRISSVRSQAAGYLPNTSLDVSPVDSLVKYEQSARLLTVLLYAFSVPIIGLILAFIGLVVNLTVSQQRNEIAVLRSRGGTAVQVLGIAALEALVLGGLAVLFGWPVSEWIASAIGQTQSFLNFSAKGNLPVLMTPNILRFGVAVALIALVAQLVPTLGASRHTIITYKQERARTMRRPWWQRAYLDIMLLIPAMYGLYTLRKQGSLILPVAGQLPNDPFQNPLLFLVPGLAVFALTLLVLRFLPFAMRAVAWVASHTHSVGLLMAARHLARTPGSYTAPLVLLVLTLSLSAYTASLAQTLDNHLYDQKYYQIGADMRVDELGENAQSSSESVGGLTSIGAAPAGQSTTGGADQSATGASTEKAGPRWFFLPVSEYLKVPGVNAAARVGRYDASTRLGGTSQDGVFIGVDRVDFPKVAFWREDFAPGSLGSLMNALATTPDGVLLPRSLMAQYAVNVGDTIRVTAGTYGQRTDLDLKIVGGFDLFPTWYPEEKGPLFVGNLDYIFEQAGGEFPYEVWMSTESCNDTGCVPVDYPQVLKDVQKLGIKVISSDASVPTIVTEQRRPERQGLFGLLSVGFVAAALLTVLGFFLYALFSFRQRTIELGILRAMGLSPMQMTSLLAWELAFLILTGLAAGTLFGAWISQQFIPFLQVGSGASAHVPPYLVQIAWPAIFRIYALFGLLFIIALGVLGALLMRMKIFQAIKLGETA
jgi:putative ABC transport system permease protein